MASGGARARSGPPPDPNALRRNREGEWTTLPAEGRQGPEPRWPLAGEPTPREAYVWRDMWRKPQAVMWEKNGQEYEVALFVRKLVEAEAPLASATLSTLVRQMMDSLGLTIPGMRAARWRLSEDELSERRDGQRSGSSRSRLRIASTGG